MVDQVVVAKVMSHIADVKQIILKMGGGITFVGGGVICRCALETPYDFEPVLANASHFWHRYTVIGTTSKTVTSSFSLAEKITPHYLMPNAEMSGAIQRENRRIGGIATIKAMVR